MSLWNQAYEDFRRPYYEEEKKSKKDYDGDGKVESGSKEHAGAVHNAIQRAKGGKADGKDTRKEEAVAEGSMKQARKNVGASTCWDGYKAKGTKKKDGKDVPNCVKEEEEAAHAAEVELQGEAYTITNADVKGNTPAYRNYKAGMKSKTTGKPMYNLAPHVADSVELEGETIEEKKGLWANIHAKRKRGEKPAKKGDKDYPETLNVEGKMSDKEISKRVAYTSDETRQKKLDKIKVKMVNKEETEVEEGYKELSRDKRNKMFRKAGNLSRTALQGGDKGTEAGKKSNKIVKALNKDAEKYNRNDVKKEEVGTVAEADSLAAMQARREKRLAAQRKREGTNDKGEDFGHDYVARRREANARNAKKEHYDWRSDFDFVIEKKSEDCGCDHTPKKGIKNKVTVMPEVKTEEVETVAEDDKSYDRNRKRAAQRAADRNAARAAGKTGVVPGVGYVTPNKERETYTDSKGTTRHKSGAKSENVEFAGNYQGPLYAPHPDLVEGGMQGAVDSITKKAQGALQSIGVKINNKPKPTARPSAQTANTMRQNSMSNEEAVSEDKKKKDDSYLETNMKKRQSNNEKARKDMEKMGTKMKNPHFEETLLDKIIKSYVSEEDYDRMKDRRQERGGVDGNNRYKSATKNNTNKFGKGKTALQKEMEKKHGKGKSAMDIVRAGITKKYGKGALIDTKKKKDK